MSQYRKKSSSHVFIISHYGASDAIVRCLLLRVAGARKKIRDVTKTMIEISLWILKLFVYNKSNSLCYGFNRNNYKLYILKYLNINYNIQSCGNRTHDIKRRRQETLGRYRLFENKSII